VNGGKALLRRFGPAVPAHVRAPERRPWRAGLLWLAIAAALAVACVGCASVPPGRAAVDDVTVKGHVAVDPEEIEEKIATAPSDKFLGLFRGVVYDYEIFDRLVLQRDLARVERLYRARGYYDAHARAGRVLKTGDEHVRVEIIVEEGKPVLIESVRIGGVERLPVSVGLAAMLPALTEMKKGQPFDEDKFIAGENAMRKSLTDIGYAFAEVRRDAKVDVARHKADVAYDVVAGPQSTFGKTTITGLAKLPEDKVRQTLDIAEGDPYSTQVIADATQALLDLGVFSSVEIIPDLSSPASRVVPLLVRVEPSRLRTVTLGGGIEFDAIKTDVHLLAGWEHRNFLGGLRQFNVEFKPGVVLYPTRINNVTPPTDFLPEERLKLQLKQPGFIEARTNALIRPEFNVFPVLLKTDPGADDPVLGYLEFKNTVGLDRTIWKLFGNVNYNFQFEQPFYYLNTPETQLLSTVILSYPELIAQLDFRNDKIKPRRGVLLGVNLQAAGGPFGGSADDIKVQPEARGYIPINKRFTFAARGTIGFLFPRNYGDYVRDTNKLLNPTDSTLPAAEFEEQERARTKDLQVTFFRGFFSGGPSSNRGYAPRDIGPHGIVPFLTPEAEAVRIASECDPSSPGYNPDEDNARCATPVGGFTLWELSAELRIDISGPFATALFCDASDVSNETVDIRFAHLHLSCGAGLRYDTPVGPIRLDLGYRIPGLQYPSDANEQLEGPPEDLFGLVPMAISFGIGEAF
jgi:outer membrane protein insertion porin family/translocation and assembly module TamA